MWYVNMITINERDFSGNTFNNLCSSFEGSRFSLIKHIVLINKN